MSSMASIEDFWMDSLIGKDGGLKPTRTDVTCFAGGCSGESWACGWCMIVACVLNIPATSQNASPSK